MTRTSQRPRIIFPDSFRILQPPVPKRRHSTGLADQGAARGKDPERPCVSCYLQNRRFQTDSKTLDPHRIHADGPQGDIPWHTQT